MILEGVVRRFTALKGGKGPVDARLTHQESLAVALVEQEGLELTRSGRRFSAIGGTTGVAPVQTVPTTAAAWALYNADTTRTYVIDDVSFWLLSGTATAGLTVLGVVSPITATLPAAATGSVISSRSKGNLTSNAIVATGYTLPTLSGNSNWFVVGASQGGVPGVGGGATFDVKGRILVPPGKTLGLTVLAGAGTSPLYIPGVTWTELELDLE